MSLLSRLLDHMPPTIAGAAKPTLANRASDRPHLVLMDRIELPILLQASTYTNAIRATTEWRHARDLYINHIMTCRACYAPTARYCLTGTDLRVIYNRTPMEQHL
ncbi:hypothetical protein PS914_05333 [Pseudomonas fluorescens]|uniref:hypothetical protein n=1 Tax=Pseudomonas fluorescens TaxID=294 RepID=UPI001242EBDB|nr:hypothetical protein [Pseudomonas fluorescens]VVQ12243.1 hypothetical protein PS914_05333 [Pseudomonas fluorescens]